MPAASASFTTRAGRPSASRSASSAAYPSHSSSMFTAVTVAPSRTTAGMPIPAGVVGEMGAASATCWTRSRITFRQAFGVAGTGVFTRKRSVTSNPWSTSTAAALIPLPPKSMPIARSPRPEPACSASGAPGGTSDSIGGGGSAAAAAPDFEPEAETAAGGRVRRRPARGVLGARGMPLPGSSAASPETAVPGSGSVEDGRVRGNRELERVRRHRRVGLECRDHARRG